MHENFDYGRDDADLRKTVKQIAGTAAAAAAVALLPVEAPIILATTVAIVTGVVISKTVEAVWGWFAD